LLKYRSQPQLIFKNSVEMLNLLMGLYFFRLLNSMGVSEDIFVGLTRKEALLKNRVVRLVLIMEIYFNVIPNLLSYSINVVSKRVWVLENHGSKLPI